MSVSLKEKVSQFNIELPLERAQTLPALWYYDEEILALERSEVFGKNWIWAGRMDQLAEPGSFLTTDLAGEPLVLSRDKDGVLRAFSNVCRHKAARVANAACGKASFLQCRYHGWTYDLSGRLKGTPEFEGVENFFREEYNLPPSKINFWGNQAFVRTANTTSLAEFLFPLQDRMASLQLEKLQFVESKEYVIHCNWKAFIDNYLDGGYHINTLHPKLAGAINYKDYRNEIARNTVLQVSPLRKSQDATVASVRSGDCAYFWWVYPNLMINVYDGLMDVNVVYPLGPERCRVVFDFYFSPELAIKKEFVEESNRVADAIQREDMEICEEVQRNLHSRSYKTGRFSVKREAGGHHFHQLLARQLQEALG